jgi:hypothetical protein
MRQPGGDSHTFFERPAQLVGKTSHFNLDYRLAVITQTVNTLMLIKLSLQLSFKKNEFPQPEKAVSTKKNNQILIQKCHATIRKTANCGTHLFMELHLSPRLPSTLHTWHALVFAQ